PGPDFVLAKDEISRLSLAPASPHSGHHQEGCKPCHTADNQSCDSQELRPPQVIEIASAENGEHHHQANCHDASDPFEGRTHRRIVARGRIFHGKSRWLKIAPGRAKITKNVIWSVQVAVNLNQLLQVVNECGGEFVIFFPMSGKMLAHKDLRR